MDTTTPRIDWEAIQDRWRQTRTEARARAQRRRVIWRNAAWAVAGLLAASAVFWPI